jgi:hypothetical protein
MVEKCGNVVSWPCRYLFVVAIERFLLLEESCKIELSYGHKGAESREERSMLPCLADITTAARTGRM